MGVTGLWRLIEPTGKPVPVETLENKVLAVDISIWLHQMVKGYQDAKGAPLPNAHLMGLFQRLCKLLYFRIKPVFVFDGAFPELKKETIAKRQDSKSRYHSESERLKRELALLLSKQTAISSFLGKQISPKKAGRPEPAYNDDELFKLPALPEKKDESGSESDDEDTSSGSIIDVHSVDLESENFKNMPVKEKYDVLIELKETRKMNSWGKLHELPKKSDNFAEFQMNRLLKRRKVQECLLETEKEMGSTGMSLNELESLLNEEGIDTKIESLATRRIASNENDRYLLISNVKQALVDAKNRELKLAQENELSKPGTSSDDMVKTESKDELQQDIEKAIQMSLDPDKADVSTPSKTDESWSTIITESDYSDTDSEENDGFEAPDMSTAKSYIMQYSDFTYKTIDDIISKTDKGKVPKKAKATKVDAIIEELNNAKTVIEDEINLSSDEDVVEFKDKNKTGSKADTDESIDLSVAYVPNTQKSAICLDSSGHGIEDNAKEVITEADEFDEELQRAIQMSLECENTSEVTLSKDIETKVKKPLVEKQIEVIKETDSESSDDDDFEEVPIKINIAKPVVELTLDIGKEIEDDIFADVFNVPNKKTENEHPVIKQEAMSDEEYSDYEVETKTDQTEIVKERVVEKVKEITVSKDSEVEKDNKVADNLTSKINEFVTTQLNRIIQKDKSLDSEVEKTVSIEETTPKSYTKDVEVKSPTTTQKSDVTKSPLKVNDREKIPETPKETLNTEQLNTMVDDLQNEADDLMHEKGRLDRIGRNITEQMTKEAQELLQIFGIPYIIAPMEAEAQCAFLETVKLTDGTITDDSDIWLFGGKTVYKNFFNQKKHVLQYLAERIEKSFNLSREQLILLAMLVGSDYTTGVSGVGPVTALEILASFPFNKKIPEELPKNERYAKIVGGLQEFKKWVKSGKRTDNTTLKKKLKNVDVNEDFPSVRVVQAYLEPNVEKNEDKFTWGKMDITVLRDYARAKFGWSQHKLDEIIKPVLKRLEDRNTQKTLQSFFQRKIEFQSLEDQMSKRVKAAVQRMGPDGSTVEIVPETSNEGRKRKLTKKRPKEGVEDGEEPKTQAKRKKKELPSTVVKVKSVNPEEKTAAIDIQITKTDRYQEIIPQREKDKQSLLQNKMKAIEMFRKTKMDPKHQARKRKANLPKEKAELSESDSD